MRAIFCDAIAPFAAGVMEPVEGPPEKQWKADTSAILGCLFLSLFDRKSVVLESWLKEGNLSKLSTRKKQVIKPQNFMLSCI